ncbi:hypothetical protein GCM10022280_04380 [Sphingomonas swuensis]|uniref:Flagellar FliJ protein n=1 Tax=Sphingomonas swuensis TaxID=977800 RepID=A0ABP7SE17_9SPHN
MSGRFVTALRIRRRALDQLALAIAGERRRSDQLAAAGEALRDCRMAERRLASSSPFDPDRWFAVTAARLDDLAAEKELSGERLAGLRAAAAEARARLSLLEDADHAARVAEQRRRDKAKQDALDDRTGASWSVSR